MSQERNRLHLWIAVRVFRGVEVEATAFESSVAARRAERRWRRRMNPDYDTSAVVQARLVRKRQSESRRSPGI